MANTKSTKPPRTVEVLIVSGVVGPSVSINGRRVAGSKPWGGGKIILQRQVSVKELREALKQ